MRREWISRCKQNTRHERLVFFSFRFHCWSSLRIFRWLSLLPSLLPEVTLMHCYPLICLSFPKHQVFQTLLLHFFSYPSQNIETGTRDDGTAAAVRQHVFLPAVCTCNSSLYRVDMRQSFPSLHSFLTLEEENISIDRQQSLQVVQMARSVSQCIPSFFTSWKRGDENQKFVAHVLILSYPPVRVWREAIDEVVFFFVFSSFVLTWSEDCPVAIGGNVWQKNTRLVITKSEKRSKRFHLLLSACCWCSSCFGAHLLLFSLSTAYVSAFSLLRNMFSASHSSSLPAFSLVRFFPTLWLLS